MARAMASGSIASVSRDVASRAFTLGFGTESMKSVRMKPGETVVTRKESPASWRRPSERARTATFVAE